MHFPDAISTGWKTSILAMLIKAPEHSIWLIDYWLTGAQHLIWGLIYTRYSIAMPSLVNIFVSCIFSSPQTCSITKDDLEQPCTTEGNNQNSGWLVYFEEMWKSGSHHGNLEHNFQDRVQCLCIFLIWGLEKSFSWESTYWANMKSKVWCSIIHIKKKNGATACAVNLSLGR